MSKIFQQKPNKTNTNIVVTTAFTDDDEKQTKPSNRKARDWFCWFLNPFLILIAIVCYCFSFYELDFKKIDYIIASPDLLGRFCQSTPQPDPEAPSFNRLFNFSTEEALCKLMFNETIQAEQQFKCENFKTIMENRYKFRQSYQSLFAFNQNQVNLETSNLSICINQQVDCSIPKDMDYVCSLDFFLIADKISSGVTQRDFKQFLTAIQYNDILKTTLKDFPQHYLFCDLLPKPSTSNTHIHTLSSFFNLKQCDLDKSLAFTSQFSFLSSMPTYVTYAFNYFANIRSTFITELVDDYVYIILGIVLSFFCSYLYMIAIVLLSKVLLFFTQLIIPLAAIILAIYLVVVFKNRFLSESTQFAIFGFENYTFYILGVFLILIAVIILVIAVVLILNLLMSIDHIKQSGNCIQVCKATLQKRLRMFAIPILFTILLIIFTAVLIFMFLSVLLGGTVKAGLGVVFETFDFEKYEFVPQHLSLAAVVFICFYLLMTINFLRNSSMYLISVLTSLWYNDRITHKFRSERNQFIRTHRDANTMRFRHALKGARKVLEKQQEQGSVTNTLNADYFNMGTGRSYLQAVKFYFANFGSIVYYSIVSIFIFIPRLFLLPFYYLSTSDMFDDLFAASTKASKITKFINNIITMTDKNLIYFMSITGFKFSDCIRKFKEVMKVNQHIIRDIRRGTRGVVIAGQILMGVVAFVLAEVMIIPFNGKGLWNFHLTRVLISFVGGFIASGYVFQLINVVNLSIIYIYNLDIIRGHPQNKILMPRSMLNLINAYGLGEKDMQIMRKDTIRCVELLDKVVSNRINDLVVAQPVQH